MKKLLVTAIAASTMSLASMSANATVLDFVAEAAGAERGITNGSTILNFQGTGIDVTFEAGDNAGYHPYFDDLSSGKPAGLGVCKVLFKGVGGEGDDGSSDNCNPSNDDNVSIDESIRITMSGDFQIRDLTFYDADHEALGVGNNDGQVMVDIGAGFMMTTFSQIIADANNGLLKNVSSIAFRYMDTQFYVGAISDVPVPGAIPLLLSGLAGLGFASRRKKAA